MPVQWIADLVAQCRPATGAEVSLEMNPTSVTRAHLRDLRSAGITRISVDEPLVV